MSVDVNVTFVDSNVLVYAYDADAGWKHEVARAELVRLWDMQSGVVSTQVLQEFYVTATRKLSRPIPKRAAREVVGTYRAWPLHRPKSQDIVAASELEERHHVSFWDALIIVSAQRSGARVILSEDLQAGRRFGETSITNPFGDRPAGGPGKE
jgi:predicted nucleic acid-binding protein